MLGRMLINRGWVTPEELLGCLEMQSQLQQSGAPKHLGEIVTQLGLVQPGRIDELLRVQYKKEVVREDMIFGQIAVRNRFITAKQLEECLSIQKGLIRDGEPSVRRLGEILLEKGYTSFHDNLAILKSQQRIRNALMARAKGEPPVEGRTQEPADEPEPPFESKVDLPPPVDPPPAPLAPPAPPGGLAPGSLLGLVFDGYEIQERIADGGMGTVYRAEQLSLNRVVAIKVLKQHLSQDAEYIHQFLTEANAAARISHGNIVQIYDLGQFEGLYYIVMEFIDGRSLLDVVHHVGPLAAERAADYTIQAARALAVGEREGIIHKDIKPENILVNRHGEVKVADYGLARISDFATGDHEQKKVLGTVFYMSPEQIEGKKLDIRTDIYSLGVTLFELLTGEVPFDLENPMDIALAHLKQPIPPVEKLPVPVPRSLYDVLAKMMVKDRDRRYQSPHEVVEALEAFERNYERSRKRGPLAEATTQKRRRR